MLKQEEFISVLTTLWAIWWARRKAIHEEEFQSPISTHSFIQKYINDLQMAVSKPAAKMLSRMPDIRKWLPPREGMVKANTDVAVAKSQNKGAVAVVLRDDRGVFRGASAIVLML